MKKITNSLNLRHALMMLVALFVTANTAWADSQKSTREQVNIDQSVGAGYTLQPGKMYIVRSSMTLNAASGNGLNVETLGATEQAPILYIPANVTVTVKGADATGTTGAGAGIYVPQGAELIITGAGTLNATGGNAANGGDGQDGQNGGNKAATKDFQEFNENLVFSGAGGNGGNGGGGAAAGIGGMGGQGGDGGQGGVSQYFTVNNRTTQKNGQDGQKGNDGLSGATMGKVYVMGTVNVNATAGIQATTGGKGGKQGWTTMHDYKDAWNVAGAGGGGAGGGAGLAPAYSIGAGGPGAGGGAGGGSGAVDWMGTFWGKPSKKNDSGRASSATGTGKGAVAGASGDNTRGRDDGSQALGYDMVGGRGNETGGNAGEVASKADNGFLYVDAEATVNGEKGTVPAGFGGNETTPSAPEDMKVTITFVNNETASNVEVGHIDTYIGATLPDATVTPYQLVADSKYFAGYYSSDLGLGTRIYKGISTNSATLDKAVNAVAFPQDVTLYAHFSHNRHNVQWDYTYQQIGGETYADVPDNDRIKKARLTFFYRDGSSESRVLTASTVSGTGTKESHLTATGAITLASTGTENLSGENILVVLDDAKLAQFTSYTFEALNQDGTTVPTKWLVYTNADNHTTTISFTGATADHCFDLQWSVTLKGLKVYPEAIFVKPMYAEPDGTTYDIISQLKDNGSIHYDGVQCAWTAKPAEGAESCTYTGTYPVWKFKTGTTSYNNKVGLVGFILGGQKYYMDATEGSVHADMVSPDTYNSANNICTYTDGQTPITVMMDVEATKIPVLRLMPNADDATLSQTTLPIYVNNARTENISLNGYSAVRPGYTQTGWNTEADGQGTAYEMNATEVPGKAALTLYAQWKEAVAPVIATKEIKYNQEGATVVVTVSDNISTPATGLKVYSIVSDTQIADPKTREDWTEVSAQAGTNDYNVEILNKSWAWVYVKAVDAADNTAYQSSPERIKIDNFAPTYQIYPEGIVCNFDVQITAKDNIKLDKVYTKKGTADWTEVTSFDATSDTEKTFILNKPTEATEVGGEGTYSLKIVDEAGNETVYDNFVTLFCDHVWDTENPKYGVQVDKDGNVNKVKYYSCSHGCGHIWAVEIIGAEPYDPTDGYKHESTKTGDAKQHQEQGLMREETTNFLDSYGETVVLNDENRPVGFAGGINEAITLVNEITDPEKKSESGKYTLVLVDDINISKKTPATTEIATPADGIEITIDLNASGLLVNGEAAEITGNDQITLLLTDNGALNYANKSTVTNSNIQYHRTFAATTRKGKWQALYLPFDVDNATAPTGQEYTFGTPKGVEIGTTEAKLQIEKGTTELAANTHYFVRSSNGEVLIETTATLNGYVAPKEVDVPTVEEGTGKYTIKGSLNDTNNMVPEGATMAQSFWVLTNGGAFTWAKAKTHQRPYHWVIYDKTGSAGARPMSIIEVEDDPTAIESIVEDDMQGGAVYSISGQRMPANAALPTGLYIRNGQKFYVK